MRKRGLDTYQNSRLTRRLNLPSPAVEELYRLIAEIDAVKTTLRLTGQLLPATLERLSHSVIVTSTGASNRIEGNRLNDAEVEALYRNFRIRKFRTRDEQEVAGYLKMLELVFASFRDIPVSESTLLQLHRDMLQYSEKDVRHKGTYKFGPNRVEAKNRLGQVVGILFDPTPPHLVPKEMQELFAWYDWAATENLKHPLLRMANLVFELLAIHPFQDGNGRVSRLLTNLLLLRGGYEFTSVVSHEKLIEANKADYYLALNQAQRSWKTRREDLSPWLRFFLHIIREQARQALQILETDHFEDLLSEKQLQLWRWASSLPQREFDRRTATQALGFPARTVESIVRKFLGARKLERLGQGRATRYRMV